MSHVHLSVSLLTVCLVPCSSYLLSDTVFHSIALRSVTWLAMQITAGCDLASSMDSSDPESYMRQQCSQGYYGPVCSLCVKHSSTQLKPYGRTGTLQCQPCRSAVALPAASALVGIETATPTHIDNVYTMVLLVICPAQAFDVWLAHQCRPHQLFCK